MMSSGFSDFRNKRIMLSKLMKYSMIKNNISWSICGPLKLKITDIDNIMCMHIFLVYV